MGQPVVHFEVIGQDPEKLRSYYGELFGWAFEDSPSITGEEHSLVERNTTGDGIGIPGGIGAAVAGYPGHVTFYVGVPDVEAALQKAEELGGTRRMGPAPIPGSDIDIGQFTDPEGHLIGLVKVA